MGDQRAINGKEPDESGNASSLGRSRDPREAAAEAHDLQVRAEERTAARVRLELEALMSALRKASELLAAADRRTQALVELLTPKARREASPPPGPGDPPPRGSSVPPARKLRKKG